MLNKCSLILLLQWMANYKFCYSYFLTNLVNVYLFTNALSVHIGPFRRDILLWNSRREILLFYKKLYCIL